MIIKSLHGNEIDSKEIISAGYAVIKNFAFQLKNEDDSPNYIRDIHFWIRDKDGVKYIIKNFYDEDNAKLYILEFLKNLYENGEF